MTRRLRAAVVGAVAVTWLVAMAPAQPAAHADPVQVLRVGSWNGIPGNEQTLDAAAADLKPGGWLLIGPGDWHPQMDHQAAQAGAHYPSAMLITAVSTHIRGMDRNQVIIDGTKPGSSPCSSRSQDQDFGQVVHGAAQGRNGPEALRTSGVWFENFTTCNFLSGTADTGNEVWWNGGDDGGVIGLHSWYGNYLSATSQFYDPAEPSAAGTYGLFVSNSDGPGEMDNTYSSNFNDSSYYVGACRDCHAVINHGHAENSALGLSSSNAGGHFLVENTEWDENKTGMVSNSMNSGDPPPPQLGNCVSGTGPLGTSSCEIWTNNYVHDNNNPNVPGAGTANLGPVGTGIVLAGTNNITLYKNRITDNGAWGVLMVPFPDLGTPSENAPRSCIGGVGGQTVLGQTVPCVFFSTDNVVQGNSFANNGFFHNPSNSDIADDSTPPVTNPVAPGNCYSGNTNGGGAASTWPLLLQQTQGTCGAPIYPDPVSTS
ncbi:MAG: right-handed parallel beta-helix repeat-containing protein, partial [Acidimicrobiia bacterium]|nr:right-handed parallel beta-helix repeat-containing protein [Acidimicrobiia bacterium]